MERLLKTPEGDKPHPGNLKDGWLDEDQGICLWGLVFRATRPMHYSSSFGVLHNFTCFLEITQKQHFHSVSGKIL